MKNKLTAIIITILIILAAGWVIRWLIWKNVVPQMKFQTTELVLTGSQKKTTINNLKGNVVIVSFFQTWCGPCIHEMYIFEKMATTINSTNFKTICISDEEKDHIMMLQSRFSPDKVLFAQSAESIASLGIHVYPTTYLLNKKGEVIKSKLEGYDWGMETETIKKLLAE